MKTVQSFIQKEFRHVLRDKKTLLILFIMPVVLIIIFGFAIRTEIRNAKIAILDNAKDALSIGLINKLLSSDYFMLYEYLSSDKDIETCFKEGKISMVITIPANFGQNLSRDNSATVQLIADASNINTATTLIGYAQAIIEEYRRNILISVNTSPAFETMIRVVYNPSLKDVYMFIPGILALILMTVSAMMTSVALTREKENGTFRILTITPLRTFSIISGKIIPYLFLSLINTAIILWISVYLLEMPIRGSLPLLLSVCFLFLINALSWGVLISSIAKTQEIAIMVSLMGLFLPTMLLSGFIYPISNMPMLLQLFCQIIPAKWFIEAIRIIMIQGGGLEHIKIQLAVLILMTIILIIVSIIRYHRKNI